MTATASLYDRLTALADPIRCRLLLAVEQEQLTVSELHAALQLPQSTVSRHLKVLSDEGWITSRSSGTSNWYRMAAKELDSAAQKLWHAVREEVAETSGARRDRERIREIVAGRHSRSQEFFATAAGQWDRFRVELFGVHAEWLALGGLLDPHWTVGDLGTGTGHLTRAIAPLVGEVIAVDESAAMIEAAKARLHDLDNVSVRSGTLESLPIDDGVLDLAFIVLVLHHLPDPSRAIAEAGRALKPGGRLVIVDMIPHERAEYRETMGHQWLGFDQAVILRWFEAAKLERATYRPLPAAPDVKGPLLFVGTASRP